MSDSVCRCLHKTFDNPELLMKSSELDELELE